MTKRQRAKFSVDLRSAGTRIDRRIYGHFLEEIGRMISGGLFPEKGSGAETVGIGFRRDVWEACRDLRPSIIRWPGGCYADVYHWRDGVGEQRPKRMPNRYWGRLGRRVGPPVHTELGTDEFLQLCKDWDAEPYLCANAGTGTPEEAAGWVEYIRARGDAPGVGLWSVGNEQFGFWEKGHTTSRRYGRRYKEFRRSMKSVDPTIRTVANGADTCWMHWNEGLLEEAGDEIDFLSLHIYLPQDYKPWQFRAPRNTCREWYEIMAIDRTILWKLDQIETRMRRVAGRVIPVAVDEWNLWWNLSQPLKPRATLRDALAAGLQLMAFQMRSDLVKVANLSSIINVLTPPILTNRDQCSRTSMFEVFRLFRDYAQDFLAPVRSQGPTYATAGLRGIRVASEVPYVAASATCSEDRRVVSTFLVNRHCDEAVGIEIDYDGAIPGSRADIYVVTGPSILADNLPGRPAQVRTVHRVLPAGATQEFVFEPRALGVLVQRVEPGRTTDNAVQRAT